MILEKFSETIKTPSLKHFEERFKNLAVGFAELLHDKIVACFPVLFPEKFWKYY